MTVSRPVVVRSCPLPHSVMFWPKCGVAVPRPEWRHGGPRGRLELETSAATQGASVPPIGDEELDTRVARVQAELVARGLKGLIAYSAHRDYQPGDLRYLARWLCKEEESACLYIPVDGKTTLITNASWDVRRAQREAHAGEAMYASEFADALKDLLAPEVRSGDRIGISGWSFFPAPTYVGLTSAFPEVTFSDETDILTHLRMIKSAAELHLITSPADRRRRHARRRLETATKVEQEDWGRDSRGGNDALPDGAGPLPLFRGAGTGPRTATNSVSFPRIKQIEPSQTSSLWVVGSHRSKGTTAIWPELS